MPASAAESVELAPGVRVLLELLDLDAADEEEEAAEEEEEELESALAPVAVST